MLSAINLDDELCPRGNEVDDETTEHGLPTKRDPEA
jgi:hypothetical protein